MRDAVVDYVKHWNERADVPTKDILGWIGLYQSTFYKWCRSYGKEYEHNGSIPRDHWLEDWERDAIIRFHFEFPLDGYRRLTYMTSVIDGYSRAVVHQEIREQMTEQDIETILQRARELHPGKTPRVITENGPQFISNDFKQFIRISGMTHVRTSPYYPRVQWKD